MLLDIGAKTSNLLFFEKGKVYSRSINIGANSITQDFANETKMRYPEAEATKIEKGSSAWVGPMPSRMIRMPQPFQKIARQVMTRLHIQVNQTIPILSRPARRLRSAPSFPFRRRVHHALYGAIFCGKTQFTCRLF